MQIPPNVQFHEDIDLLVWKPRGIMNEAMINKILSYLAKKETMSRKPFDRFIDTSAQEGIDLSFKYVFHVALYRRLTYAGRPPIKSAFFVTKPEAAHLVKLHATMTDQSPLQVEMFEQRQAAADWLGVPIDRLEME